MDSTQSIKYHIPPMIIFFIVVISCLIIGFLVDYIMQKYGCCGRKGGCCRPENEGGDVDDENRGGIPLVPLNTRNNPLPGRLHLLSRAPQNCSQV